MPTSENALTYIHTHNPSVDNEAVNVLHQVMFGEITPLSSLTMLSPNKKDSLYRLSRAASKLMHPSWGYTRVSELRNTLGKINQAFEDKINQAFDISCDTAKQN